MHESLSGGEGETLWFVFRCPQKPQVIIGGAFSEVGESKECDSWHNARVKGARIKGGVITKSIR